METKVVREFKGPFPARMRELSVDERGYPVPWFVSWHDGKPEFRAMDLQKFVSAVREKRCWVCGQKLGVHMVFVAGPMCGVNRTSSEPPCHAECAEWSAVNCPFLSNPNQIRREDEAINNEVLREESAGFAISRNPGVAMLWFTRVYDVFKANHEDRGWLIQMGEPDKVDWYREGRRATRAEVLASIDSGLPSLENIARQEKGGLEALMEARKRFEKWIPV